MDKSRNRIRKNAILIAILAILILIGASVYLVLNLGTVQDSDTNPDSNFTLEEGDYQIVADLLPQENNQDTTSYICSSDYYNCDDFTTQAAAQEVLEFCGGVGNDIHVLDYDHDEVACEWLD